jgi:hypothetical protein
MWASWRGIEYTIRGKVVASPKSGPWWVLWIRVCPWLVLAPKVLQLCTNQLVVWFCAGPCEWLNACHSSVSHPGAPAHPSTPKVLRTKERVPNFLFFRCFHFKLTFWIYLGAWEHVNSWTDQISYHGVILLGCLTIIVHHCMFWKIDVRLLSKYTNSNDFYKLQTKEFQNYFKNNLFTSIDLKCCNNVI